MRDITGVKQNLRSYGGLACLKVGITLDGKNYLVKFPGNLKAKNLKNIDLSYSNGSVCEYLGSHIFEQFGLPTHHTELATRDGKLVVMCEDFIHPGMRLAEFRELKATYEPAFVNAAGEVTDGVGSDLQEALLVIRNHPTFQYVPEAEKFFWKMFIIDAFIGNPARNNGNWGLLIINDEKVEIAPIYDNGNGLNNKWDDAKMQKCLSDEQMLKAEVSTGKVCFFTQDDKRLNPFKVIESAEYPMCTEVLHELMNHVELPNILTLIDECDTLTDVQRLFYRTILSMRFEKLQDIAKSYMKPIGAF